MPFNSCFVFQEEDLKVDFSSVFQNRRVILNKFAEGERVSIAKIKTGDCVVVLVNAKIRPLFLRSQTRKLSEAKYNDFFDRVESRVGRYICSTITIRKKKCFCVVAWRQRSKKN